MPASRASTEAEHVNVLIIGSGISGIGAAYHLQTLRPGATFTILEVRAASGGIWDLFRYPSIRSGSTLHTFDYEFKPWRDEDAIAGAEKSTRLPAQHRRRAWRRQQDPLSPPHGRRVLVQRTGTLDHGGRGRRPRDDSAVHRELNLLRDRLLQL